MNTLYLDCGMGAAGDMLFAALLELHPDPAGFLKRFNALGIPGVSATAVPAEKCGITGTSLNITVNGQKEETLPLHEHSHKNDEGHHHEHHHEHENTAHEHHEHSYEHFHDAHDHSHGSHNHEHHNHEHDEHGHNSLHDIEHIVDVLPLPQNVREHIRSVYSLIAEAEGAVHGKPASLVHFHEVGALDAVADITGVCMLLEELAPDAIYASPVHTGSGQVRCAHGILPVPAPATALLLKEIPVYSTAVRGELCTPTGAALLRHFVNSFGSMPVSTIVKIGYGMGKKDFEAANCLRAFLTETVAPKSADEQNAAAETDEIAELCCNLDDMTPETLAFAQEVLFENGALDVFTMPVGMKKSRQGVLFTCLCRSCDRDKFVTLIFKHTTTLGIRQSSCKRFILTRSEEIRQTAYGPVRVKKSSGYGVTREKCEYDDIARIARSIDVSVEKVKLLITEN